MAASFAPAVASAPRVLPEVSRSTVKATLRFPEIDVRRELGQAIDDARREVGWTIDRLARELPPPDGSAHRDERQVQRWIDGKERAQFDVLFACGDNEFVRALYEHLAPFSRAYARNVEIRRMA